MVLKRREMCRVIRFNSWTAVMVWLDEVVGDAFMELIHDYLKPFEERGERNPPGTTALKEYFVRFAEDLELKVQTRMVEMESGAGFQPDKAGCE
jgi:hypothetical protein